MTEKAEGGSSGEPGRQWQEYDCPISGIDFDIEPPIADGTRFYCSGCGGYHVAGVDVELQLLPVERAEDEVPW